MAVTGGNNNGCKCNFRKDVYKRQSLDNLKLDDDVMNIPLFMADQADRLIGLALEQLQK